ncbi:CRISPR-associated protein, Csm1 family [Streptococcus sp. DD11]|uniref:type III-A CRISPR-associated protein Cas10/Csm1 n=1 Tax=Streptococcus sp. DD11 TaxID=1777879 RepID=UPI0007974A89|nr:type III-A CRISPR-associated protein Cas10/Csm1 [Streptococcus sp. DD11]KXT78676.1 CRISPR-associated protein, Csm1 family [Streptococcus sp. DD11]
MKKEKLDLVHSALFYDLGRLIARAENGDVYSKELEKDWLGENVPQWSAVSLQQKERSQTIIRLANQMASGLDTELPELLEDKFKPLADIFNVFKEEKSQLYKPLTLLEDGQHLSKSATLGNIPVTQQDYERVLEKFATVLKEHPFTAESLPDLLHAIEALFSFVPVSPAAADLADINVSQHSLLTAGFAAAIWDYLEELGDGHLDGLSQEEVFLLASFDVSGIQDFIYHISSSGAAKQLKARSLYLDLMSEHIVDSLLEKLELSRTNLLYVGGGHAYFILPNTEKTLDRLQEFEEAFNHFLLENFQTGLYVAFGWTAFAAREIASQGRDSSSASLAAYRTIYQKTSQMISEKKLSRYDAETLKLLNKGGKNSERECEICHSIDKLRKLTYGDEEQYLCHICDELRKFSKEIGHNTFRVSSEEASGLPIGPGAVLVTAEGDQSLPNDRIYVKNKWSFDRSGTHIFAGDYLYAEIHEYADLSQDKDTGLGIRRLAVVRLDVDDLGAAFMAGFSYQKGGIYSSFSRSAIFSRNMSLFFKFYIQQFAAGKKLTIIYAGGDDVFAIGAWKDVIDFTIDLRQAFLEWSDRKLTLSAGIGLFADKTPISLMASYTGELEEAAKEYGKDSLSLFEEHFTFKFDDFITEIYQDKLTKIRSFFKNQDERGKVFIYRLIELLRDYTNINTARLAYYLARLENSSKDKDAFIEFKNQFFSWYKAGAKERKEAETALLLYLYETRKD